MAKRISRVQKLTASLPTVEERIAVVAQALNGYYRDEPNEGRYNTRLLLLLIKRFQAFQAAWESNPERFFARDDKGHLLGLSEFTTKKYGPIMRLLARYRATPGMDFAAPAKREIHTPHHFLQIRWTLLGEQYNKNHELFLVLDVMEIAQAGRIDSLKQCEHCRKWLFARFPHQRFCSENCKEHFHRFNEADKKRRREWARKNYWLHKYKNIK
jgi:hypothetical protein